MVAARLVDTREEEEEEEAAASSRISRAQCVHDTSDVCRLKSFRWAPSRRTDPTSARILRKAAADGIKSSDSFVA